MTRSTVPTGARLRECNPRDVRDVTELQVRSFALAVSPSRSSAMPPALSTDLLDRKEGRDVTRTLRNHWRRAPRGAHRHHVRACVLRAPRLARAHPRRGVAK